MTELSLLSALSAPAFEAEFAACNRITEPFGLTLSKADRAALLNRREQALRDTGRVEFSGGIFQKLVYAFCDSPYLAQQHYADTLGVLLSLFYAFKSDLEDEMTDNDLLEAMRDIFDHRAQGSLAYLADITLSDLCRLPSHDDCRNARGEEEDTLW